MIIILRFIIIVAIIIIYDIKKQKTKKLMKAVRERTVDSQYTDLIDYQGRGQEKMSMVSRLHVKLNT